MMGKKTCFLLFSAILCNWLFSIDTKTSLSFTDFDILFTQKDIKYVQKIAPILSDGIDDFQRQLGQYPDFKITIKIAADNREYHEFTSGSNGIIEFSEAFYSSRNKTIYLRNPAELKNFTNLYRILLHEYIHAFIDHYWQDAPLWFHEGMAVFFSNDLSLDREFNFIKNYLLGNSRKLIEMERNYPENRIEWESFYAKAGMAVKYLFQNRRADFFRFWDDAFPHRNFKISFQRIFLMSPSGYSLLFEDYSRTHFRMEILLASTGIIWSIFPLILIIGWIRKKIVNRRIIGQWQAEDKKKTAGENEDERI